MDRAADSYSQSIRGVDAYHDPTSGRAVELPGGYKQVWTNGLGEYLLSDEAGFDPNIGSTINRTLLPRQGS